MALRALVSTSTASRSFCLLLASRRTFASSTAKYVPLLRLRPLLALSDNFLPSTKASCGSGLRCFSTNRTASSLNDPSPNWSNRPPKETILLDGCDFEHWLVVVDPPDPNLTRDEIIKSYIQYLAKVVGSEEEARFKIYSVSTKHYFAFGALVSEELSYKLKELPGVRWVLPDSYLDVRNKDYGGEPFINGEAVPYDPKYHEEWVRNNARANERNRRNDRPRNYDRSRNFERRRENMQNFQNRPPPPPPPMPGQDQAAQCAQNPMPPRDVPNQSTVPPMPNAMPRSAPNPGYQNQMPYYQGSPGNSPYSGPSNAHQGGLGGYQGPPNAFQGGPGGYPGAPNVPGGSPPGHQGISNAGPQGYPAPATPNSPQGGPGGYQGGPRGYQGAPNAYQGPPGGYQGPGNSYQGGGGNPYPGTPNSPQGGRDGYQGGGNSSQGTPNSPQGGRDGYQGGGNSFQGTPNSPQGGPGAYLAGGSSYTGRDMPGRDQ